MRTLSRISRIPSPALFIVALLMLVIATAGVAQAQVIYKSTVSPLPGNLPSEGAEAYAFNQFGDGVTFAGTSRKLSSVVVTLSSWGCQTGNWYSNNCVATPGAKFTIPITINIYNAGNPLPGSLITTRTQIFSVPYRPSADPLHCTGPDAGKWYDPVEGICYNGLAKNITFYFTLPVMPNSVVYGIVYNTTHSGPSPIGESAACFSGSGGCPYDSLNIALAPAVVVGSKPFPDTIYQNTSVAGNYCDSTPVPGTFRLDSPTSACWAGYVPAVRFNADTHLEKHDDRDDHDDHNDHDDHGPRGNNGKPGDHDDRGGHGQQGHWGQEDKRDRK